MTLIQPNTVSSKRIMIGGSTLYIGGTYSSKSATPTKRNVGTISKDSQTGFKYSYSTKEQRSGTPSKVVAQFMAEENLMVDADLSEVLFNNLQLGLNAAPSFTNGTYTDTVQASPAPTTTTFTVSSTTGLAVNDLIEVELDTGKEYRYIKTINTTSKLITVDEAFSAAPTSTDPVKDVTKAELLVGAASTPLEYGLTIVKKLPLIGRKLTFIVFKAVLDGGVSLSFKDDEFGSMPLAFKALSDPTVENGALGIILEEKDS